jgi:hypothetical protein
VRTIGNTTTGNLRNYYKFINVVGFDLFIQSFIGGSTGLSWALASTLLS